MGLLWWMWNAWTRFEITETNIQNVRETGATAELVGSFAQAHGTFETWGDVQNCLGDLGVPVGALPDHADWLTPSYGPRVGVMHDGWLGQFLLIHEESQLVAVRQIAWDHPQARAPESGFPDFPDRMLAFATG